ncbi:MAG: hypothetical protein HBSAPP02_10660 [Phycisphaerae bacterium]|nr:MAG: hypothetical protein HBSAPP02_10660 [Phycisphaerae bacterium]
MLPARGLRRTQPARPWCGNAPSTWCAASGTMSTQKAIRQVNAHRFNADAGGEWIDRARRSYSRVLTGAKARALYE